MRRGLECKHQDSILFSRYTTAVALILLLAAWSISVYITISTSVIVNKGPFTASISPSSVVVEAAGSKVEVPYSYRMSLLSAMVLAASLYSAILAVALDRHSPCSPLTVLAAHASALTLLWHTIASHRYIHLNVYVIKEYAPDSFGVSPGNMVFPRIPSAEWLISEKLLLAPGVLAIASLILIGVSKAPFVVEFWSRLRTSREIRHMTLFSLSGYFMLGVLLVAAALTGIPVTPPEWRPSGESLTIGPGYVFIPNTLGGGLVYSVNCTVDGDYGEVRMLKTQNGYNIYLPLDIIWERTLYGKPESVRVRIQALVSYNGYYAIYTANIPVAVPLAEPEWLVSFRDNMLYFDPLEYPPKGLRLISIRWIDSSTDRTLGVDLLDDINGPLKITAPKGSDQAVINVYYIYNGRERGWGFVISEDQELRIHPNTGFLSG